MSNIVIESHELQPLQPGEEEGMPTYRVVGTHNGNRFSVDISCEIDGREVDFHNSSGLSDNEEEQWGAHGEIFETLCDKDSFSKLHQEQCNAYYES